jgi:hypothetical protein
MNEGPKDMGDDCLFISILPDSSTLFNLKYALTFRFNSKLLSEVFSYLLEVKVISLSCSIITYIIYWVVINLWITKNTTIQILYKVE